MNKIIQFHDLNPQFSSSTHHPQPSQFLAGDTYTLLPSRRYASDDDDNEADSGNYDADDV